MSTGIVDPEDYPRYQLCKVCGAKDCDCTLADLVNKQAKEIARLESNAALISGKHASELALLIKGQDELRALAKKMAEALEIERQLSELDGHFETTAHDALSAYRELIKE